MMSLDAKNAKVCGRCTIEPEILDVTKESDPCTVWQCECVACGMRGGASPHKESAVHMWNAIHLGEVVG